MDFIGKNKADLSNFVQAEEQRLSGRAGGVGNCANGGVRIRRKLFAAAVQQECSIEMER
jgi:hypothetical protein